MLKLNILVSLLSICFLAIGNEYKEIHNLTKIINKEFYNENYTKVINLIISNDKIVKQDSSYFEDYFFKIYTYSIILENNRKRVKYFLKNLEDIKPRNTYLNHIVQLEGFQFIRNSRFKRKVISMDYKEMTEELSESANVELAILITKLWTTTRFHRNISSWEFFVPEENTINYPLINKIDSVHNFILYKYMPLVDKMIDQYGFPYKDVYDGFIGFAFVDILHHSDKYYQIKYMGDIQKEYENGNIDGDYYAMYYDRYLTFIDKPQYYGTQFKIDKETGKSYMMLVEEPNDLDSINERRKQVGLKLLKNLEGEKLD